MWTLLIPRKRRCKGAAHLQHGMEIFHLRPSKLRCDQINGLLYPGDRSLRTLHALCADKPFPRLAVLLASDLTLSMITSSAQLNIKTLLRSVSYKVMLGADEKAMLCCHLISLGQLVIPSLRRVYDISSALPNAQRSTRAACFLKRSSQY